METSFIKNRKQEKRLTKGERTFQSMIRENFSISITPSVVHGFHLRIIGRPADVADDVKTPIATQIQLHFNVFDPRMKNRR